MTIKSGDSEKFRSSIADAFESGTEALKDVPRTKQRQEFGRVCPRHARWVGRWQVSDPCYSHVWRGAVIPGGVEDDS